MELLYWLTKGSMSSVTFLVVQMVLRVLLALVFVGMGILHLLPASQRTMAAMIPPKLRWTGAMRPRTLVIITGVCEIAGGLGLVFPPTTMLAGICLVVFLAAVFPANAYAARNRERFGRVATPLIPRLVGQLALMLLIVVAIL